MQKIIFTDSLGNKVADASAIYQLGGFHNQMEFAVPQDPSKPTGQWVSAKHLESLNNLSADTNDETLVVKLGPWSVYSPAFNVRRAVSDPALDQVFVDENNPSQVLFTIARNGGNPVPWTPYTPGSKLVLTQYGRSGVEFQVSRIVFFLTPAKQRPTHVIYLRVC